MQYDRSNIDRLDPRRYVRARTHAGRSRSGAQTLTVSLTAVRRNLEALLVRLGLVR